MPYWSMDNTLKEEKQGGMDLKNDVNNNHCFEESEAKMSLVDVNGDHSCYENNQESQSDSADEAGISSQIDSDIGTQSSGGSLGSPGIVNSPMIKAKCFYGSGSSSLPKSRFRLREESLPFEQRNGKQSGIRDDLDLKRQNKSSRIARKRSQAKQISSPYPMKNPRAREDPKKNEPVKKPGLVKIVNKKLSGDCIARIVAGKAIVPLPNEVDGSKDKNIPQSPMFSSDADSQDSVKRNVKILVNDICKKYEGKWNGNDSAEFGNTDTTEAEISGVADYEDPSLNIETNSIPIAPTAGDTEGQENVSLGATEGQDCQFSLYTKDVLESNNHHGNIPSNDYDEDPEDDTGISLCSFMDTSRNISFTEKERDDSVDDSIHFSDPTDMEEDISFKNNKRKVTNALQSPDETRIKFSKQSEEKTEISPTFSIESSGSSIHDLDSECQLLSEEFEAIESAYALEAYDSEQKLVQGQSSKKKVSSNATGLFRYFQKTSKTSGKDLEGSKDCIRVSKAVCKTENLKGNNVGKVNSHIIENKKQLKIKSASDAKSSNGDVIIEDLTASVASPKTTKKPRKPSTSPKNGGQKFEQLYIDVGQKNFGHITCPDCGMVYTKTLPEDALQHSKYHQKLMQKLKFKGWKTERVLQEFHDGRIIQINQDDNSLHLKKVAELREVVDGELGFAYATTEYSSVEKAFLFVSNNKIIGCAIAVPITKAYPVITTKDTPSPEKRQGVPTLSWCCSSNPVPALCGISRIWVLKKARRQKVAVRLIDAVRSHFIFGVVIGKDKLAFSDPTPDGRLFAEKYSETANILVFR